MQAPLCECNICTCLTLGIPLHQTAFPCGSQRCFPRCCHLMSAVLTGTESPSVTGSSHHFVTAKSKLTTQTSHNVMQLIMKVFHLQRKKKCILHSQLPSRSEGCHAAVCAKRGLVLEALTLMLTSRAHRATRLSGCELQPCREEGWPPALSAVLTTDHQPKLGASMSVQSLPQRVEFKPIYFLINILSETH